MISNLRYYVDFLGGIIEDVISQYIRDMEAASWRQGVSYFRQLKVWHGVQEPYYTDDADIWYGMVNPN